MDSRRRRDTRARIARDIIGTRPRRHATPSTRHRSRVESSKCKTPSIRARACEAHSTRTRVIVVVVRDSAVSSDVCPSAERSAIHRAVNPDVPCGMDVCPFGGTRTTRYSTSPFPLRIPLLATILAGMSAQPFDAGSKNHSKIHCLARYCGVLHANFDTQPSIRDLRRRTDHTAHDAGRTLIWINAESFAARCVRAPGDTRKHHGAVPDAPISVARTARVKCTPVYTVLYFPRYPRSVLCNHRDVDSRRL